MSDRPRDVPATTGELIDPERFAQFRKDFGEETDRLVVALLAGWSQLRERLADAAREPDRQALVGPAHTLAGECMLIGAGPLQRAAGHLERLCRQVEAAPLADVEHALADIDALWSATERTLVTVRR